MQRYIETLFRRKDLFLIPIIFIPLVTLMVSLVTGREFVVNATVWVEPNSFLTQQSGSSRTSPNERQAIAISDRLRTVSFRREIMDRSGLTDAVIEGTWPKTKPGTMPSSCRLRPRLIAPRAAQTATGVGVDGSSTNW